MSNLSDFLWEQQKKQAELMKAHPEAFDPNFYEKTTFEEIVDDRQKTFESVLENVPMCEVGVDDHDATSEWVYVDDEGAMYSTYRCDEHAVKDPEYEMRDL